MERDLPSCRGRGARDPGGTALRVLYVSHTSIVGGGERSLLELIDALPDEVEPALAAPAGELADAARERGVPWEPIPGTSASARLTLRHTVPALAGLTASAAAVRRVRSRIGPDVVHANSTRAGLIGAAGGRGALVVHVRDVLPRGAAGVAAGAVIRRRAAAVLANSGYTATRFGRRVSVAAPWVDVDRFDPAHIDREQARAQIGVAADGVLLGVVGQLTPWKGQLEAVETLAGVRRFIPDARLVLCGSVRFDRGARYDNRAYERGLHEQVRALHLEDAVSFLAHRDDVEVVMRALDVLLVPSWEEPFGRAVIEGMAAGLPVVATSCGGPAELVEDGRTGLLLPPRAPDEWARRVTELLRDRSGTAAMGVAARARALATFSFPTVDTVLRTYREVAPAAGRRSAAALSVKGNA